MTTKKHTPAHAIKPKRKLKVVKITKLAEPKMYEIVQHVESDDPPPLTDEHLPIELPVPPIPEAWPDPIDFPEAAEHKKAWSLWKWICGDEQE